MTEIGGFLLDAMAELGGGRGAAENFYVPHLIAMCLWGTLCAYEIQSERADRSTEYSLLLVAFTLSFLSECVLFTVDALLVKDSLIANAVNAYWPPLEHTILLLSRVVLGAAFLQLLFHTKSAAIKYLAAGLVLTIAAYTTTAFFWYSAVNATPTALFANHKSAWIIHSTGLVLAAAALVLLLRSHRRLKKPIVVAFAMITLAELLMLANLAAGISMSSILTPIRGNLNIWAIPLLGFAAFLVRRVSEKQQEHGIQNSERLESLGQLSSGIAHDFNNHLQIILGYVELARIQKYDAKAIEIPLDRIEEAAERSGTLVNQLLAFSRSKNAEYINVDLNEIITGLTPMVSRLLGPNVKLVHDLDLTTKPVLADQRMLEQIIVNLIVNARDAMPDGGTITVQSRSISGKDKSLSGTTSDKNQLMVSDTGSGMDKQTIRRAFEPFFTTKPVGRGTGLGLATVYGIVQKHNGHVSIDSKLGQYTKVYIELPASTTETADPAVLNSNTSQRGSETILLAEDEVAIRDLVHQLLIASGYNVLVANDGQHAINIASTYKRKIDLCVFDVIMPRLNGYQTYDGILELGTAIPVLFVTGSSSRVEMLQENYRHLQKPFTRATLLDNVRRTLDEAAAEKSVSA